MDSEHCTQELKQKRQVSADYQMHTETVRTNVPSPGEYKLIDLFDFFFSIIMNFTRVSRYPFVSGAFTEKSTVRGQNKSKNATQ